MHIRNRSKAKRNRNAGRLEVVKRSNILDEGIINFGQWLNSENRSSTSNPIVLKEFVKDRFAVLQDNVVGREVVVDIIEGVPICARCNSNDCSHVGFTICVEQMENR